MKITIEKLSKMLKRVETSSPSRDHDIGWNNAILQIMNMEDSPDLTEQARSLLPKILDHNQISEIVINLSNGENLQAVKNLKDGTGFDLKLSKEILDGFKEKFGKKNIDLLSEDLKFKIKQIK